MGMIKSISYDQQEIIKNIILLYIPSGQIDLDPCYSKGVFYKDSDILDPTIKLDINPQVDGVEYGDCRQLPLQDDSINSIVFDPPFLATTGPSLSKNDDNNKINKRFGVYDSEKSLHQMYYDSLKEFYRVLKNDGILIVKCQDKISSGKQYLSHIYITNMAENIGFYAEDLFILLAKNRIVADWQVKNQKHARKFHSYFIVFRKKNDKAKVKMSYNKIQQMIED